MTMALPSLPGGTGSKVADLYEAAWTVDRLLDLLADEITELHLEPPGEDGLGVEFYTVLPSGAREYHSVKRQAPASSRAWTPYQLIRSTPTPGRSVLGDLFRHLDGNDRDRVVFVSAIGCRAGSAHTSVHAKRVRSRANGERQATSPSCWSRPTTIPGRYDTERPGD